MHRRESIRVVRVGEGGQVEQDEAKLERAPCVVMGVIKVRRCLLLAPTHRGGVERAGALEGHCPVGKAEGVGCLRVGIEQCDAFADARQGQPTAAQRLGAGRDKWHQVGRRRLEPGLLAGDPVGVGIGQWGHVRGELTIGYGGEDRHINSEIRKAGETRVSGCGRGGLGDIVSGQHHRAYRNRAIVDMQTIRVTGEGRIHRDPVADREFNLVTIKHRGALILHVELVAGERAAAEDGGFVRSGDGHLGLEDPGAVLVACGFLLAVDQEEGDDPRAQSFADHTLERDTGMRRADLLRCDLAVAQGDCGQGDDDRRALPGFVIAAVRPPEAVFLHLDPRIVPPAHGHDDRGGLQRDGKGHADGGGQHSGGGLRRRGVGRAILAVAAAKIAIIVLLGDATAGAWGEHPNQVAPAHGRLVQHLRWPVPGAEQLANNQVFKLITQSGRLSQSR